MNGAFPKLQSPRGQQMLRDFDLSPACNIFGIFGAFGEFDFTSSRLELPNFDIKNVAFPSGASHLALTLGLLHFDFETLNYQLKTGVPLILDRSYTGPPPILRCDTPEPNGTAIAVLGIKFYMEVAGTFYLLREGKSVGVKICEVRF